MKYRRRARLGSGGKKSYIWLKFVNVLGHPLPQQKPPTQRPRRRRMHLLEVCVCVGGGGDAGERE